jgi:hypothetical protein
MPDTIELANSLLDSLWGNIWPDMFLNLQIHPLHSEIPTNMSANMSALWCREIPVPVRSKFGSQNMVRAVCKLWTHSFAYKNLLVSRKKWIT